MKKIFSKIGKAIINIGMIAGGLAFYAIAITAMMPVIIFALFDDNLTVE